MAADRVCILLQGKWRRYGRSLSCLEKSSFHRNK